MKLARSLVLLLASAYLVAYVAVALVRIGYPYELEWMEGGMVDHVRRLLDGRPIYAEPSLEFVSFLYPPLYYGVSAVLSALIGPGFLPLRLISFASSLGVLGLLFQLVRRETGETFSGVVAAGLFAATFERGGFWFDLARVDSFFMLLLLGGVYGLRVARAAPGLALAGLFVGAAALTKQTALVLALPLACYAVAVHRWRAIVFIGVETAVALGGWLFLDRTHDGWFSYYCFELPAHHPRVAGAFADFWTVDLLGAVPVACIAALFYVVSRLASPDRRAALFHPLFAAGAIVGSWSARSLVGAEANNLFPAFAALAVLAAVGAHEARVWIGSGSGERERLGTLFVHLAVAAQLVVLAYDPRAAIPTAADRAAGRSVVGSIAAAPGEVYVPHHGYLARLAGKESFAHTLALDNVTLDDPQRSGPELRRQVEQALAARRFSAVIVESDGRDAALIGQTYGGCRRLFDRQDVFRPVSGNRIRPELLCIP